MQQRDSSVRARSAKAINTNRAYGVVAGVSHNLAATARHIENTLRTH
ncbi:hypothetical protein [Scardovia wiggsiae]|nr:hypothetical protein [Scardovia wiggsiae]